ncbi:methyltransferase domain-containing protein [Lentzea sp. NPDC051838]|uniref:class I SAM-dependent methyltransferase n=1 Tax=Lentzea sp. NPDC051838 TaxID=3154849 RepID=UPI003435BD0E
MTTSLIDEAAVEGFAARIFSIYTDSMLTLMIDVGSRTGLFDAAAAGPATSAELAERAGLQERYVREWLGAMSTGDILRYDPATRTYTLPPEHAACLAGDGSANIAPLSLVTGHLATHLDGVIRAFHTGGGVPYEAFRPRFTEVMDTLSRGFFDGALLDGVLPLTGDLPQQLARGIRVADIGCGTGHAVNLLAAAYPSSEFVGYDIAADAIAQAQAEATGLTNARFEVHDVIDIPAEPPLDAIFAFDAIHDQADPVGVLRSIYQALRPGGTFVMFDIKASSHVERNLGNPLAPYLYSISTLHCMTVSLALGGAGLGTCWGEELARQMLIDTGFEVLAVTDVPDDPLDVLYLARKPR